MYIFLVRALAEVCTLQNAFKITLKGDMLTLLVIIHSNFCKKPVNNFSSYLDYEHTDTHTHTHIQGQKHNLLNFISGGNQTKKDDLRRVVL